MPITKKTAVSKPKVSIKKETSNKKKEVKVTKKNELEAKPKSKTVIKSNSNATGKNTAPKAGKTSVKGTGKTSVKITAKTDPKIASKTDPKVSAKTVTKVTTKANPKLTGKTAINVNAKKDTKLSNDAKAKVSVKPDLKTAKKPDIVEKSAKPAIVKSSKDKKEIKPVSIGKKEIPASKTVTVEKTKKSDVKTTRISSTITKTVTDKDKPLEKVIDKQTTENGESQIEPRPVLPNVRYSDEDLDMFKDRISGVRQEAIDELRMLRERLDDLTNYDFAEESMIYSMHMAEQGSEAFEKEKTYAQIQRINEYIQKLDVALNRIKDKTYGLCRVCGCLIAKERLLAVPITTLSASYKIQKKCPEDGIDRIEPLRSND